MKNKLIALVIILFFTFGGWIARDFYFQYMDTRQYVYFSQPMTVDKKVYIPCETVIISTILHAEYDVSLKSLTHLILTNSNGDRVRIGNIITNEDLILAAKPHKISYHLQLPCDIASGTYFWQGIKTYSINGVTKNVGFITEQFTVDKRKDAGSSATMQ